MTRKLFALVSCLLALCLVVPAATAQQISGDYLESRSADVYVAQCFANGEVGLNGKQALLAWHVRSGSWQGQNLQGLSVVAAVRTQATLGDPFANPYPARAVLLVDERATPAQREALVAFARHMAPQLLSSIERVLPVPVSLTLAGDGMARRADLRAGKFAAIETRPISTGDHICGNETTYYPPLVHLAHSMPAVALTDEYSGPGLGISWDSHGKRSAFIGTFDE